MRNVWQVLRVCVMVGVVSLGVTRAASAQTAPAPPAAPAGVTPPADYVIGPDDSLSIIFWKDKDMSAEVVVRPDGMISLPLLNDVQAAGLTPDQLRANVTKVATKWVEDPNVMVIVKEIKSRKVYITGQVSKPSPYPLAGPTTVLQLISMAGGLLDFADGKNISIIRVEKGQPVSYRFNYNDVLKRRNLKQNIELKPGDQVVVP